MRRSANLVFLWSFESDLKCMTKIVSAILILREGNSPDWTSTLDTQMTNWTNRYINWLTTADLALQEASAAK